jgi:hypothetical protein
MTTNYVIIFRITLYCLLAPGIILNKESVNLKLFSRKKVVYTLSKVIYIFLNFKIKKHLQVSFAQEG